MTADASSAAGSIPVVRVHFLITDLEIGGTPRVVKELAIRLRPLGFETSVTCLAPWGPVADELTAAGVPVSAIGVTGARKLPAAVRGVRAATAGADVVFSFLVHANGVAALALAGRGTPLVQSIQTTQPRPAWQWWASGLAGRAATRIVVPSPSVAEMATAWAGLPAERIVVIPNAVDSVAAVDQPARGGPWRVGFVGRLDPIKRVPDLVAAMPYLGDATLDVYGDGPDRLAVIAATDRLGLRDRVTLHGTVPSAAAALATLDVLVLPSDAEGFGLVLIEALAAGVPVVATNVAGIRDVIGDGENGLLVPPRDPAAIAAAVGRIRDDNSLRGRFIDAGRREVELRYAWPGVLARYADLLRDVAFGPLSRGTGRGSQKRF